MKKLVKTLKINKLEMEIEIEIEEKFRPKRLRVHES